MHEESSSRRKVDDDVQEGAIPAYLMDRDTTTRAKVSDSGANFHIPSDQQIMKSLFFFFNF